MELLGDVGQMKARFGLFLDSASLDTRGAWFALNMQ
jgi:hypothetical protein